VQIEKSALMKMFGIAESEMAFTKKEKAIKSSHFPSKMAALLACHGNFDRKRRGGVHRRYGVGCIFRKLWGASCFLVGCIPSVTVPFGVQFPSVMASISPRNDRLKSSDLMQFF
jgi:hypothetical protein